MHTCAGCGLLLSEIPSRQPRPGYERMNEGAYLEALGSVRESQAGEVVALIREQAPPGNAWLDIGCGYGYLLRAARQAGFTVLGFEPDERAAAHARSLLGEAAVRQGMMTGDSVPDGTAAVISMLDVLEHVPAAELASLASTIQRKLLPGGLWVIKVPSTEGLYFQLAHVFPGITPAGVLRRLWQSDYAFPHTVYFSSITLRRFLERHGFEVIAQRYLADVPNATVRDRLRMDDSIPTWQAPLLAPAFYGINFIEKLRGKSDALVMLARRT